MGRYLLNWHIAAGGIRYSPGLADHRALSSSAFSFVYVGRNRGAGYQFWRMPSRFVRAVFHA